MFFFAECMLAFFVLTCKLVSQSSFAWINKGRVSDGDFVGGTNSPSALFAAAGITHHVTWTDSEAEWLQFSHSLLGSCRRCRFVDSAKSRSFVSPLLWSLAPLFLSSFLTGIELPSGATCALTFISGPSWSLSALP